MQFFEKIDNFGHFSGPFRLRNDQIYFYTRNNVTNSPKQTCSHIEKQYMGHFSLVSVDFGAKKYNFWLKILANFGAGAQKITFKFAIELPIATNFSIHG